MEREIKFRAFCEVDTNEGTCIDMMVYFNPIGCDNGIFMDAPKGVFHINEYHSPLMQFTGLKDKNGKDIYEGDIVKSETYNIDNEVVEFNYGSYEPFQYYMSLIEEDFEVTGNIHEKAV